MPQRSSPTAATSLTHGPTRSTFLAAALAGLTVMLFAIGVPKAVASDDHNPPSAPTNVRVLATSQTSLTVAWDASTDDVGVKNYRLWLGYPPSLHTKETQYTVTGLRCGQSITLEIRAYDDANNKSEPTLTVVSSAPCVDSQPPSAPAGLRQIAASATTATLAWNPATDNVAVAGYSLSRSGVELATTSETSYSFSGLVCGKTHAVAVRSYDVARNYSSWVAYYVTTASCGDVTPPSAPTGLVQTNTTTTGMSVAWSAATDNVGVAGYDVFRNGALAGSASGVSYALSGLTCGTAYAIGVEAVDGAGNRSARTSATMSTAACVVPPPPSNDTQPPTTPANLALAGASPISVTLTWAPSTDNVGVAGYRTFLDGTSDETVTGTAHMFQGLSCGTSHLLGVMAVDAKGNHSQVAAVTGSTAPCSDTSAPTAPGNVVVLSRTFSSITVGWAASTDNLGVAGYGAYVDGSFDGATSATSYTFAGLACNTSVVVGIDAYDAAGNRSPKVNVAATTTACNDSQPPTTPAQLTISGATTSGFTLNWTPSSDNQGVQGYDVFVDGSKVASVVATEFTLSNLACGTSYQVGVEAFDGAGNRSGRRTGTGTTTPCTQPPPTSGTAYVSPNGSDANLCTIALPCKSFNRAYSVAQPGATVSVAAGTYTGQDILWRSGRDSGAPVVFRPTGPVTIQGTLRVYASGVHIAGQATGSVTNWRSRTYSFTVTGDTAVLGDSAAQHPKNVTLEGIDTGALGTYTAENVIVRDIDAGPVVQGAACNRPQPTIGANIDAEVVAGRPRNVTWERVVVHGFDRDQSAVAADCHTGGLFIVNGYDIKIRQSVFSENLVYNIQVQNYVGSPAQDVVIENTWFGCPVFSPISETNGVKTCNGQASLQFNANSTFSDWLVRFNSFSSQYAAWGEGSYSNVRFVGNAGRAPGSNVCGGGGISFQKNAWTSETCGSGDVVLSSLPFVNVAPGQEDLHLTGGAAVNFATGSGTDFELVGDIDGQSRPAARDAGADETG
ncbi:MAG: fibronectin type III domain-containing protein [Actinobacteria bacterium]|nr:fibronectin type III domain-containing protein [Actinomycetota bacterium]